FLIADVVVSDNTAIGLDLVGVPGTLDHVTVNHMAARQSVAPQSHSGPSEPRKPPLLSRPGQVGGPISASVSSPSGCCCPLLFADAYWANVQRLVPLGYWH